MSRAKLSRVRQCRWWTCGWWPIGIPVLMAQMALLLCDFSQGQTTVWVDDFGAVGNGLAYDDAAIQSAMDVAGRNGTVQFSRGKIYNICSQLFPREGQTLEGNGATLRRCDAISTTLLEDAPAGATSIKVADPDRFLSRMSLTPLLGSGHNFGDGENLWYHVIEGIAGNEVTFSDGLDQAYPAGSLVTNTFHMIHTHDHQTVRGFIFDGNRANNDLYVAWTRNLGVYAYDGVTIRDNVFRHMTGDAISIWGTDGRVESNVFYDTNTSAVHLSHNTTDQDITIANNLIVGTSQQAERAQHAEGAITISWENNNIRVLNNIASNLSEAFIGRYQRPMGDWTVSGNQVFDAQMLFRGDSNDGRPNLPVTDIVWTHNYAQDVGRSFLDFDKGLATDFSFIDNTIVNGSFAFRGVSNLVLENNRIRPCGVPGIEFLENISITSWIGNEIDAAGVCEPNVSLTPPELVYDSTTGELYLHSIENSIRITRFVVGVDRERTRFDTNRISLPFADTGDNTIASDIIISQSTDQISQSTDQISQSTDQPVVDSKLSLGLVLPPDASTNWMQGVLIAKYVDSAGNFGDLVLKNRVLGDTNGDGSVDAADMGTILGNWGGIGEGDLNFDDMVDAGDAEIVFANWTGDGVASALPEPNSLVLGLMAFGGVSRLRRRNRPAP